MARNYLASIDKDPESFSVGQSRDEAIRDLKEHTDVSQYNIKVYSFIGGICFKDGSFDVEDDTFLYREQ
jgi:hypothetical protein